MSMEEQIICTAQAPDEGMRLDAFIARETDDAFSRTYLQKLIGQERVRVNGKTETQKKYKLKPGDQVDILLPPPAPLAAGPENIPLDIVYEDGDVVVVNKAKGMVVHPAPGNEKGTLVNALLFHCRDLSSIGGVIRPGIVHRIDKDTSGLLMVAKNDRAHICLSEQLKQHSIVRIYHAVASDNFREDSGTVDAPIGRDPKNRFRMSVVREGGRRAVTHYRVVERFGRVTLIEARLETGRTHQIRVHMAYIRHPLVGDPLYGGKRKNPLSETQLLHAGTLGFSHPSTGEYLEFSAEPPEEFQRVIRQLREGR